MCLLALQGCRVPECNAVLGIHAAAGHSEADGAPAEVARAL